VAGGCFKYHAHRLVFLTCERGMISVDVRLRRMEGGKSGCVEGVISYMRLYVDTVAASPFYICTRNFSYLHPPTIDEISKPMHLSDHKAFEAMYRSHRCLLSC
jgi:hypothetical protein